MTRWTRALFVTGVVFCSTSAAASGVETLRGQSRDGGVQDQSVAVYVFTAPAPDRSAGFIDPVTEREDQAARDRADSVADIREALRKKRNIRLVETPEEARLKIEVVGRNDATMRFGSNYLPFILLTHFTVENYSLPMTGTNFAFHPGWKGAAENLSRQIQEWIDKNRARLKR